MQSKMLFAPFRRQQSSLAEKGILVLSARRERPDPPKIHWSPPSTEQGHYHCERDWSRDTRYSQPQKPGDTPFRVVFRKLGHAFEVWPIVGLVGLWHVLFAYIVYISFRKIEVWVDRSHGRDYPPWDWERCRDNYWKQHTLSFDPDRRTHTRLPAIVETLQDEMVAAAKERGTRPAIVP